MKSIKSIIYGSVAVMTLSMGLQSCSLEAPFDATGEGTLNLVTDIRGDVKKTRAIDDETLAALREKCVVYIENTKGIVRKYKGLDNIPADIKLKTGSYVAEAWSGDSVSASFSAKFYRGYQRFDMQEGNNSLTLRCNIANVVASVAPESLDAGLSDMKVTFSHSHGSLDFDEENIPSAKGYFMMPNADKDLEYVVTGKKSDGSQFERHGVIENVERAHEYSLKVTTEDRPITEGGALIRITIVDIPIIEDTIEVFTAPAFKGVDFNLAEQVVSLNRNFRDTKIYICGYFGMSSVVANFSSNFTGMTSGRNILSEDVRSELAAKGITVEVRKSHDAAPSVEGGNVEVDEVYITFSKAFLDGLAASATEYKVEFTAVDGRHKTNMASLRIANTEDALEKVDPVTAAEAPDENQNPMAITSRNALLSVALNDESVSEYGIEYRESGTSAWTKVKATSTRASVKAEVRLTGLKANTTYEYRAYADDFSSAIVQTFKTEPMFTFPNASFEDWDSYSFKTLLGTKNIIFPGTGEKTFWDSGNEGAATANKTLTNKSTDMVHSGTFSARLASDEAMGVLAAGNIFAGLYVKTDGTNGVLSLGREMGMCTHPSKLVVWANYRPGSVNITSSSVPELVKGANDHGQIYVALTDEPIEVRTKPSDQKLFSADDEHVLAYGQVTWTEAFGPDGALQKIEIPLVYKERANSVKPTHVVVTACASKFGDFFAGSSSSVLYLDDIEFVYE